MRLSRRGLLRGAGALAGARLAGTAAGSNPRSSRKEASRARESTASRPPEEAYQPQASKNWWYVNGHLFAEGDLAYDFSTALVADHGGDAAGHLLLFTLVGYEDGRRVGTSVEGRVVPSTERYAARFEAAHGSASAEVVRYDADPFRFLLRVSVGSVELDLLYRTRYDRKVREDYLEGGGTANVLFWNQAACEGTLSTPAGDRGVDGVGFLEHVWGTWSRAPQKGIDFVNAHLGRDGKVPRGASAYFRRTFYHGTPATGPVHDDVGPVLYLTPDGERWYAAREVECIFDGRPCSEHRTGTPDRGRVRGTFADGGELDVRFDQRPHATISIPGHRPLGNVHEGAADLRGHVRFPGEARRRPVAGLAQTEHQRFAPFYPY